MNVEIWASEPNRAVVDVLRWFIYATGFCACDIACCNIVGAENYN